MSRIFTIPEIKSLVKASASKSYFNYEKSDINQQMMRNNEIGFEAVLTGHGDEKTLIPEDGTVIYLFRGQSQEYIPCYPSLYRESPRPLTISELFTWRMRLILFRDMLDTYPIVDKFFKRHNFKVDYEGLAQHYGLLTSVLDLTSNLDIALFFATCWYDSKEDCYKPFDDGKIHDGILYVFCPLFANEPSPLIRIDEFMKENITPIGLQPFLRPARQKGYALHIPKDKSTKSWAYRFQFSNEDSLEYYNLFNEGRDLWIPDILAEKTKRIAKITTFSFDIFGRTYDESRPKGFSRSKLKKELINSGISLTTKVDPICFSEVERNEAIAKWNDGEAKLFCDTIGRRPWYEKANNDKTVNSLQNQYRTLKMLGEVALLRLIQHPEAPDEAEWINYKNTPNETHRPYSQKEQEWTKIPGYLVNAFTQRYLEEKDYLII